MTDMFVDESGDLGKASERYFVIALIHAKERNRIKNIVKHFCAENNLREIKASRLTFPQRQDLLNKLRSVDDHKISYIVIDKKHISNPKLFEDKNLIYNYAFQHVIKRLIKDSMGDIDVILDNHSTKVKSINSLRDYIKIKAYTEWNFVHNINIAYMDSVNSRMLQMADVIANAIYRHYLHEKDHLYELLNIQHAIRFPDGKFNT